MSIDERFRLENFLQARGDESALQSISAALQQEILERLHEIMQPTVESIISDLKNLGHELKPYGTQDPGDIGHRDDMIDDGIYSCRLRLGVDTVVSVGFSDTVGDASELSDPRQAHET